MRKSCFCGISAIFFQYCFISGTQILMTFLVFFSRNHFLEVGLLFNGRGSLLNGGGVPHRGHQFWWGCSKKIIAPIPPSMGNPVIRVTCGSPMRVRKQNQFSYLRWQFTKVMAVEKTWAGYISAMSQGSREVAIEGQTDQHVNFCSLSNTSK